MNVTVVLKSADFDENKGPMLFDRVFDGYDAADSYIMSNPGIGGSKQGRAYTKPFPYFTGLRYNGFIALQRPVLTSSDFKKIIEAEQDVERLKKELNRAESLLEKMKKGE